MIDPPMAMLASRHLALVRAARGHERIEVDYVSLSRPDREGRIIVPHTLVWTGLRWHVRAWCEKNQDYRDFVLSRFRGEPELLGASSRTAAADQDWQTQIEVLIGPDPRLNQNQQAVIAQDYGMVEGRWRLTVRAKLLPYLLKLLQLDTSHTLDDPKAQQIVILNNAAVSSWLFD